MCICKSKGKTIKTDRLFQELENTGNCPQSLNKNDWRDQNLMVFLNSFEIPRNTRPETKKLLRILKEKGIVKIEHDGGLSQIIRLDMDSIAEQLEIIVHNYSPYSAIYIWDEKIPHVDIC